MSTENLSDDEKARKFMIGDMVDESLLPKHRPTSEIFRFFRPDMGKRDRTAKKLCLTDVLFAGVQLLNPGARTLMHSHAGSDGLFFILKGRMAFYGSGDVLVGEVGPLEGVIVPRETKYWFEAVGDEQVELLHIEAFDKRVKNKRTNYAEGSSVELMERIRTENVII